MRLGSAASFFCVVVVVASGAACSEVCDDGVDNDGNGDVDCDDAACGLAAVCGNCGDGVLDDAEACDDGNVDDGDGCDDRCVREGCGDGVVDDGEECDDGDLERGDGCNDRCEVDRCGDGTQQPDEECDDGNGAAGDGCTNRCRLEREVLCGNFQFDPGESCDDGNKVDGDGCTKSCAQEFCGDGVRQPRLGEQCDGFDVEEGAVCNFCQLDRCGNGRIDPGEQCDDGNTTSGDDCTACKPARCGNGIGENAEGCDDGNNLDNDGCSAVCVDEFCGDDVVNGNEVCDGGDGCNEDCFAEDAVDGEFTIAQTSLRLDSAAGVVDGLVVVEDALYVAAPSQGVLWRYERSGAQWLANQNGPIGILSAPAPVDFDGRAPRDVIGCAQNSVAVHQLDGPFSVQQLFLGMFCNDAVVVAEVDGDDRPDVVAVQPEAVSVMTTTPFGAVDVFFVEQPLATGFQAAAALRRAGGGDDVVAVAGADGSVFAVDFAGRGLTPTARRGLLLLAVDVDGDGVDDDLVSALGSVVEVGDDIVVDSPVAAKNLARGDVDGDGTYDVVVVGGSSAVVLLSSRGFASSAPFAIVAGARAVVDADAIVVVGGRENLPVAASRVRFAR